MNVECADLDVLNTTEGVFKKHEDLKEKFDLRTFMSLPIDPQGIVLEYLGKSVTISDLKQFNDEGCKDNPKNLCNLTSLYMSSGLSACIYPEKRKTYQDSMNNGVRSFCSVKYSNPESNYYHLVSILIRFGADIHASDSYGNTPLHYAARNGNDCLIRLLVEQGADCCARTRYGWTPREELVTRDGSNMNNLLRNTEMKQKAIKARNRLNASCSIS